MEDDAYENAILLFISEVVEKMCDCELRSYTQFQKGDGERETF